MPDKQSAVLPLTEKQRFEFNKLKKRLRRQVGEAIVDYRMINDGDKVMVCLSGGKDSYTLLDILSSLKLNAPVSFDIVAVNLDQKQPGFPGHVLPQYLADCGVPFHIIEQDTYGVVKRVVPEGQTTCGLCSRLRRGALYRYASENGIDKIALGHHRDDILETFFLNLFHGGTLKAMAPKLLSDNSKHIVIRPLAYCKERDITEYARLRDFPLIPCNLCGSQPNLQRQAMKEMLREWDKRFPGRSDTIFGALKNVAPSHLADPTAFDFAQLETLRNSAARQPNNDDGLDILSM
ncbi:MAG: tRNA 2-thiocytidine(32) synthetase TtcA [Proteobacteria bacterium]|nr:tRNA 2-thiocytidine(32) synthetase TtcA [Pseudomonadota bacterium]